ncbi:hypothetical protein [Streptomyces sp. NPDC017949]|uniref:hypothetical protein n=1 Tax=Streptomyces sp. NPDC017949 TaxID=3365020 RepID=UPI0037B59E01
MAASVALATVVSWAPVLTYVLQSVILLVNCVILYSNLTAVPSVTAAFARKGDEELARVDVAALLKAAEGGFPAWVRVLQNARHAVVFGASIAAIVITALA